MIRAEIEDIYTEKKDTISDASINDEKEKEVELNNNNNEIYN